MRPKKDDGEKSVPFNASMKPRQRDKLIALGGSAWIANKVDRAPWPKKEMK